MFGSVQTLHLVPHGIDPSVSGEVVDKRYVISTSVECGYLSRSPYVGVDYVQVCFTHIPFFWEWMSALLAKLACLTNTRSLFPCKIRESDDDSFGLHVLELLEIDVVDSLVPQFQVGFNFEAFCKHKELHLLRFEDELLAFSLTVSY